VQRLAQARWNSHHTAVQEVNRLTESWLRGAPRPVPIALARQAVQQAFPSGGSPHVVLDCRCFLDRDPEDASRGRHARFREVWIHTAARIYRQLADLAPTEVLHISCYCRSGEMRSVAFALLLKLVLERRGMQEHMETAHLCEFYWERRTCGGRSCPVCSSSRGDPALAEAVDRAGELWDSVSGRSTR
jgi:hypothetical protein